MDKLFCGFFTLIVAVFFPTSVYSGCSYYALLATCKDLNNSFPNDIPDSIMEIQARGYDGNVMNTISKENFKNITNLSKLDLSKAQLRQIAVDTFDNNRDMTKIILFGNELSEIAQGTFSNMPVIEELDISSNRLTSLPDGVFTNTAIKNLKMNGNFFTAVPRSALSPLKSSLERFEFSNNQRIISVIKSNDFTGFEKLKILQLSGCGIRTIEEGAFDGLQLDPNGLDVKGNEFNCDCDILPFYKWAKKELSAETFSQLECSLPAKKSFSELMDDKEFLACGSTERIPSQCTIFCSVWLTLLSMTLLGR